MDWSTVITDPALAELPFKIELNQWGKIEMSPASNLHSLLQTTIAFLLKEQRPTGKALVECSIQTANNVKVADVVWCSDDFFARHGLTTPYPAAPEIVVEVVSPSNTLAELSAKKDLYFAQGAQEVWICEETGALRFYHPDGQHPDSASCPGFPRRICP